jgi:hypothetical protein
LGTDFTVVRIAVLDVNDVAPVLDDVLVAVDENANATVLTFLQAFDGDSEPSLTYSLLEVVPTHGSNLFVLDPQTGALASTGPLDFEVSPAYSLRVAVSDGVASDEAVVQVTVRDLNDNSPVFQEPITTVNVSEASPTFVSVATVVAVDADSGAFGRVSYALLPGASSHLFAIHPQSGAVTLVDFLDFEDQRVHRLHVIARDEGTPPRSSQALVVIHVLNENDLPPAVEPVPLLDLNEESPIGTVVGQLAVTDPDGLTTAFAFTLLGDVPFAINAQGIITANAVIDREGGRYPASFAFFVRVSDGLLSTTVPITVRVLDINDNAPRIVLGFEPFEVQEEQLVLPAVVTGGFCVQDADLGPNAVVTVSVLTPAHAFQVETRNGCFGLVALVSLDREASPVMEVTVLARDPSLNTTMTIIVHLLDVNDNAPEFDAQTLELTVLEDGPGSGSHPRPVGVVNASDRDAGAAATVRFALNLSSPLCDFGDRFGMDAFGTVATLPGVELDFEAGPRRFACPVLARDLGQPPLATEGLLVVVVQDVNDNAPRFTLAQTEVSLSEAVAVPRVVFTLQAADADADGQQGVSFALLSEDFGLFDVVGDELRLVRSLDFDSAIGFVLTLQVEDEGIPSLSSTIDVTILVEDANNRAPVAQFVPDGPVTFVEDSGVPLPLPGLQLEDPDPDFQVLAGVSCALTSREDSAPLVNETLRLSAVAESLLASMGIAMVAETTTDASRLQLTGVAALADYAAVLGGLEYTNLAEEPANASRTVRCVADDGLQESQPAELEVRLQLRQDQLVSVQLNLPGNVAANAFVEEAVEAALLFPQLMLLPGDSGTFDLLGKGRTPRDCCWGKGQGVGCVCEGGLFQSRMGVVWHAITSTDRAGRCNGDGSWCPISQQRRRGAACGFIFCRRGHRLVLEFLQ